MKPSTITVLLPERSISESPYFIGDQKVDGHRSLEFLMCRLVYSNARFFKIDT